MEDKILTEAGENFLEDVSESYRNRGWQKARSELGLGPKKDRSPVLDMPFYKKDYGQLLNSEESYVAKMASFNGPTHIYCYDNGQDSLLASEEFIEPLAWLESNERGDEDIFAEVKAWDADFKWLLMEKAESVERSNDLHREKGMPLLESRGWKPIDIEVAYKNEDLVAIDYGLVEPEDGWSLDESHALNSDRCIWNRPTVPGREPDYDLQVDQQKVYNFIRENAPPSATQKGKSTKSKYDAFRAFELNNFVNRTLSNPVSYEENSLELTEAIKKDVKDSKTISALLACTAEYSGLEAEYVEGIKKPKTSQEKEKTHAWTSIYFGDTEHLVDPVLQIIGRYDPMKKGHNYVEERRTRFRPLPASP